MYVDKLNSKISEEMYNRLFNKLIDEVRQKEYNDLKNKKEYFGQDDSKAIERVIKEFLKLEKPTPDIIKVIINRIEIHQNKQVDIVFNFRNISKQNDLHT